MLYSSFCNEQPQARPQMKTLKVLGCRVGQGVMMTHSVDSKPHVCHLVSG
jgi:hypothetical protein